MTGVRSRLRPNDLRFLEQVIQTLPDHASRQRCLLRSAEAKFLSKLREDFSRLWINCGLGIEGKLHLRSGRQRHRPQRIDVFLDSRQQPDSR